MVAEANVGSEESVSVIIDPADPPAILAARSPILAGAETRDGTEITDADVGWSVTRSASVITWDNEWVRVRQVFCVIETRQRKKSTETMRERERIEHRLDASHMIRERQVRRKTINYQDWLTCWTLVSNWVVLFIFPILFQFKEIFVQYVSSRCCWRRTKSGHHYFETPTCVYVYVVFCDDDGFFSFVFSHSSQSGFLSLPLRRPSHTTHSLLLPARKKRGRKNWLQVKGMERLPGVRVERERERVRIERERESGKKAPVSFLETFFPNTITSSPRSDW